MSEEPKTDVEMSTVTEEVQKAPAQKEASDLPIEDIDDIEEFEDEIESQAKKTSLIIENHAYSLVQNMEKLKNDKDTCDVILRVKKGNYYWASFWAHKSVLAANSPVFAEALKKFTTYGLPAVETVCRPNLVLPRKIHGAALAALVDWMYTGKLTVHRKALGHLPLVAYYLKVQPLIEKLEEIFGDFKESGVSLIDQEVADIETVGAENDDNEDEKKEEAKTETTTAEADKPAESEKPAEEEPKTEDKMDVDAAEELKKQKEWVVNLWVKRKWADELPKVKPIPGFYIMLQSDSHRVKSSRGRKGQDPFDPPESVLDTNWLAAYNQFKAKQLVHKKGSYGGGRGGGRGGPPRGRGRGHSGPPRGGGWGGPPRGGGWNQGGGGGGYNNYNQGYNQPHGWNQGWGGGRGGGGWVPRGGGGGWRGGGGGGPPRGRGGGGGGGGWRGNSGGGRGRGRGGPRGGGGGRGRGRPQPY